MVFLSHERPRSQARALWVYTRVSTEYNLDLAFNSLDAQREACEAYIKSQAQQGWRAIPTRYDDGAFSGASLERPALQQLLADVRAGQIDIVLVYKVDRLTRSLADFAKLIELFDAHNVSFVIHHPVVNTSSSMGRLTLNVLLSFPVRTGADGERRRLDRGLQAQRPLGRRSGRARLMQWCRRDGRRAGSGIDQHFIKGRELPGDGARKIILKASLARLLTG